MFLLDGGVENLLALTPVLGEWFRRRGEKARVETDFPEVFRLNPHVAEAGRALEGREDYFDLNLVTWPKMQRSVTEVYAEKVLGDSDMGSWRAVLESSREDEAAAARLVGSGGMKAAFCMDDEMPVETARKVRDVLLARGYASVDAGMESCGTFGIQRAAISMCDVFVGTAGPAACVAYATDTPTVVCHTWRPREHFRPFRRGVPHEDLACGVDVCDVGGLCMAKNGFSEFGKVYGRSCSVGGSPCRDAAFDVMVSEALDKMLARA